jgi:hypothetical protein
MDTIQFSQAELVQHIWTNRDVKSFRSQGIKQADLNVMSIEDLTALATAQGISLEPETKAEATPNLQAEGIKPFTTVNGTVIYYIELELLLVKTGVAHFKHGDKTVVIQGTSASRMQDCVDNGSAKIGDLIPFHYHGADTFKMYNHNLPNWLAPNNTGARAEKFANSGTILAMNYAPFAEIITMENIAKEARKAEESAKIKAIALKNNKSERVVQLELRKLQTKSVQNDLAEAFGLSL